MQGQSYDPLIVTIETPNPLEAKPGETVALQLEIQNPAPVQVQAIVVLAATDEEINRWCAQRNIPVALGPQQRKSIALEFNVSAQAYDDLYRFELAVVDMAQPPEKQFKEAWRLQVVAPNPLEIGINPPDRIDAKAGESVDLGISVLNQGAKGAKIDVFISEASQELSQWCQKRSHSFGLAPNRSDETTFQFQIPTNALPGTYGFTIEIDSPNDYPEDTPIQKSLQLRVLDQKCTVVRANDPVFRIEPPSSASKPVKLKPGNPLVFEFVVDNRANLVDSFRLTTDLDPEWFTIRYPRNTMGTTGLANTSFLELNPGDQGLIQVELHPPSTVLAGTYYPIFRLYSKNDPKLYLQDLIYFEITEICQLGGCWMRNNSGWKRDRASISSGCKTRAIRFVN
jgi:uncharacterized membrane protein